MQVSYLNFERHSSSIAAVGIANGMMVSCNKLRSGFENVGSVTGTFYPPVASPHDQSIHYNTAPSAKSSYSMQSGVESGYNTVQCNRQQNMGHRVSEGCSGNFVFFSFCLESAANLPQILKEILQSNLIALPNYFFIQQGFHIDTKSNTTKSTKRAHQLNSSNNNNNGNSNNSINNNSSSNSNKCPIWRQASTMRNKNMPSN